MRFRLARIFLLCLAYGFIPADYSAVGDSLPNVDFQSELSSEEKSRLIEGTKLLRYGDSIERVRTLLGDPTYERDMFGKDGRFASHNLDYYIRRVQTDMVNIRDQFMTLEFDAAGQLQWVVYNSMAPVAGSIAYRYVRPDLSVELYYVRPPMPESQAR